MLRVRKQAYHVHTFYLFFCFMFSFFFELYEYNQWGSVMFTTETTQRWIRDMKNGRVLRLRYVLDVK